MSDTYSYKVHESGRKKFHNHSIQCSSSGQTGSHILKHFPCRKLNYIYVYRDEQCLWLEKRVERRSTDRSYQYINGNSYRPVNPKSRKKIHKLIVSLRCLDFEHRVVYLRFNSKKLVTAFDNGYVNDIVFQDLGHQTLISLTTGLNACMHACTCVANT